MTRGDFVRFFNGLYRGISSFNLAIAGGKDYIKAKEWAEVAARQRQYMLDKYGHEYIIKDQKYQEQFDRDLERYAVAITKEAVNSVGSFTSLMKLILDNPIDKIPVKSIKDLTQTLANIGNSNALSTAFQTLQISNRTSFEQAVTDGRFSGELTKLITEIYKLARNDPNSTEKDFIKDVEISFTETSTQITGNRRDNILFGDKDKINLLKGMDGDDILLSPGSIEGSIKSSIMEGGKGDDILYCGNYPEADSSDPSGDPFDRRDFNVQTADGGSGDDDIFAYKIRDTERTFVYGKGYGNDILFVVGGSGPGQSDEWGTTVLLHDLNRDDVEFYRPVTFAQNLYEFELFQKRPFKLDGDKKKKAPVVRSYPILMRIKETGETLFLPFSNYRHHIRPLPWRESIDKNFSWYKSVNDYDLWADWKIKFKDKEFSAASLLNDEAILDPQIIASYYQQAQDRNEDMVNRLKSAQNEKDKNDPINNIKSSILNSDFSYDFPKGLKKYLEKVSKTGGNSDNRFSGSIKEDDLAGGGGNDVLMGAAGDDRLDGGADDDRLYGDDGNDTLDGGSGEDTIVGGRGADTLSGGMDADKFVFSAGDGKDIVRDMASHDTVLLFGTASPDDQILPKDLYREKSGEDVILTYGDGDSITFVGGFQGKVEIYRGSELFSTLSSAQVKALPPPPRKKSAMTQIVKEGSLLSFTLPTETFGDLGDLGDLDVTVTSSDGQPLPSWLSFDKSTGALTGTPTNADVDIVFLRFTATNSSGESVSRSMNLFVENVNDAPELTIPLADQSITRLEPFSFTIPENTFTDVDKNDTLTLKAVRQDGSPLPDWLVFDPSTGTFSGSAGSDAVSSVNVTVIATDRAGESAEGTFLINVDGQADNNDIIAGSEEDDTISTGAGNDYIAGYGGNDTLRGESGNDYLDGGTGDDTLTGGTGNDALVGGPGTNVLDGGDGYDRISYGDADAGVTVDLAAGTATGADRSDTLISVERVDGSAFADTITGNDADNILKGKDGDDSLFGMIGNDMLYGGAGADTLNGGAGNDYLVGGAGDDTLVGGTGDDALVGGPGTNVLDGGDGYDRISYGDADAGVTVDLTAGTATGADRSDTLISVERVDGSAFADTITGNDADNILKGKDGDDSLFGMIGNDMLYGGAGADTLNGGAGNDYLVGGAGADTFVFNIELQAANKDNISDFNAAEDTVQLDTSFFTALENAGILQAEHFHASETGTAADDNDYILYNTRSGALFYDADGSGSGAAVQFATLANREEISEKNFILVAS